MREISPAENASCEEYYNFVALPVKRFIDDIRRQKKMEIRPLPSSKMIDHSQMFQSNNRRTLVDKVASLVDENLCGRSDMCRQYAELMEKSLTYLGYFPRIVIGTASYFDPKGRLKYKWPEDGHDWIIVGDELIDGNIDSIIENPAVPGALKVYPYWGKISDIPADRVYVENKLAMKRKPDSDVENIWWPDLRKWLELNFPS